MQYTFSSWIAGTTCGGGLAKICLVAIALALASAVLAEDERAGADARRADESKLASTKANPDSPTADWKATVGALYDKKQTLFEAGEYDQAIEMMEQAVALLNPIPGKEAHWRCLAYQEDIAFTKKLQMLTQDEQQNFRAAVQRGHEAWRLYKSWDLNRAHRQIEKALAEFDRLFGRNNQYGLIARELITLIRCRQRDFEGAFLTASSVVEIQASLHGENHPLYAKAVAHLAQVHQASNDWATAEKYLRKCLALDEALFETKNRPELAHLLVMLTRGFYCRDKFADAQKILDEIAWMIPRTAKLTREWVEVQATYHAAQARLSADCLDLRTAEANLSRALDLHRQIGTPANDEILGLLKLHSSLLLKLNRADDFERVTAELEALEASRPTPKDAKAGD